MNQRILRDSLAVCALLLIPAAVAWVTGRPFIFPSLGPSAFAMIVQGRRANTSRQVIGGHLVGVIGGLAAYWLLAAHLSIVTDPPAFTVNGLRLVGSAVLSIALTTGGMLWSHTSHAPACATTLIISLGLLSSLRDGAIIMAAVIVMYGIYHVGFWPPPQRSRM